MKFIADNKDKPFFLYLAFDAPHGPTVPADQDKGAFANFSLSPAESDISDKPTWVRDRVNAITPETREAQEKTAQTQLETLQSVDRAVERIVNQLEMLNLIDRTVIVFTSDNGYMWGEHGGVDNKTVSYEESIKVPMIIRAPNNEVREVDRMVTWNLDLPKTIMHMAGLTDAASSGKDLSAYLYGNDAITWDRLVLQAYSTDAADHRYAEQNFVLWAAVRTEEWKYVEYPTGEKELYDLVNDPREMASQHDNPAYAGLMTEFAEYLKKHIGLSITTLPGDLPDATLNEPYRFEITSWGGAAPFTWEVTEGSLPSGLTLDRATGILSGIPDSVAGYGNEFEVTVIDGSISPQTQMPHAFEQVFVINLVS
jgi:arylsulfatase A-like enzyme